METDEIKNKPDKKIFYLFLIIIILFIIQISSTFFLLSKINQTPVSSNVTSADLNKQIASNNAYLTGLITQIDQNISSYSSNLQKNIASVQASCSSDFTGIITPSLNAVVSIKTDTGQGTGFLISQTGYVVTNAHVLSYATYANAVTSNQQILPMQLIGYNTTLDIALLKINGTFNNYFKFRYIKNIHVGDKVIAIGNPLGLGFSVSQGIVSAIDRTGDNNLQAYIQTDASLNPGNSGGPLIGTDGNVLGINNYKANAENIGFALESDYIKLAVNQIAKDKLGKNLIS